MRTIWRMVIGLLVVWLLILLYMSSSLYQSIDGVDRMEIQLIKAMEALEELKNENRKLFNLAKKLKMQLMRNESRKESGDWNNEGKEMVPFPSHQDTLINLDRTAAGIPSVDHEILRRDAENGVVEMWYYISSQLKHLKRDLESDKMLPALTRLESIKASGNDYRRAFMRDVQNLSLVYDDWRKQEAKALSELVQKRIHYVQNPDDCSSAKKLVCKINKECGYGCQLHHVVYCFLVAFGTERTLILDSAGWQYSSSGWKKYFLPPSDTCTDRLGSSESLWTDDIEDIQVVELPIVDNMGPRPPYMPQAIPRDISDRLIRLHGHPFVWWVGQFIKYLIRPQPDLAGDIDKTRKRLKFKNPIVGIHVRRTDKLHVEAAFHDLDEYMSHVDEYYDQQEMLFEIDKRRVYLASDDPSVVTEARNKYQNYEIISDDDFSRVASLLSRYSDESLRSIILDIHFLSRTDYLVCTFSSQVCRTAYEIMQTLHPDASRQFKSLDDIYYFGGQNGHSQVAIMNHAAQNSDEIDLEIGDVVGVAGNHWDGFSKGVNRRTEKTGVYPSYKVRNRIEIVDFPTYPNATKKSQT